MGATGRAGPREWQVSRAANRSRGFVARGVYRLAGKSIVRPHILVKSAVPKAFGGGQLRTDARFAVASRAMDRRLHLQGRAGGHGGRARLALSAPFHYSIP